MKINNSKARSPLVLLAMAVLITLKPAAGYLVTPFTKFHMCMMNELSQETLYLKCYNVKRLDQSSNDGAPLVIPAHNSYNWTFHPWESVGKVAYYCNAEWGNSHFITLFEAFYDSPAFVDGECGGRHCIWKYADEGVYLYNIQSSEYRFMYPWGSHKV